MIEVDRLSKHYGDFVAVDEISFGVAKGEVLGFLGPNGAGKSTTMKMLTGFITPTSGSARINGMDIQENPLGVKAMIGYLPESAPSYKSMSVFEFLSFIAEIRQLGQAKDRAVQRAVEQTSLGEVLHQSIETLSKGYRQRVCFAQALLHEPKVLILDEPTDGLDPNQKYEMRKLIKGMAKDKVIILSTHILEEMEAVCTRAIIINHGKLVVDGAPSELLAKSHLHHAVSLGFEGELPSGVKEKLDATGLIEAIEDEGFEQGKSRLMVFPKNKQVIMMDLSRLIHEQNWPVTEMHLEKGRMDEVFRNLTKQGVEA